MDIRISWLRVVRRLSLIGFSSDFRILIVLGTKDLDRGRRRQIRGNLFPSCLMKKTTPQTRTPCGGQYMPSTRPGPGQVQVANRGLFSNLLRRPMYGKDNMHSCVDRGKRFGFN